MTPSMDAWKSEAQVINSRCGFCAKTFTRWQDRADHLAKEFRNGATMRNWKGCRGLDPHVAQHVTNAMPPYLIANESKSPFPFSATNSASMKHPEFHLGQQDLEVLIPNGVDTSPHTSHAQNDDSTSADNSTQHASSHTASPNRSPNRYATCWEILTLRLGQFAREYVEKHGTNSVTDAMLQSQARRILYDADDPWEQTAADNPEWLNLFRKAHGMELTRPQAIGNEYSHHDVLEDLGLSVNAKLDQSFDLNHFGCVTNNYKDPVARARAYECSLAGTMALQNAGETSIPITNMPGLTTSATTSGASNLPITSFAEFQNLSAMAADLEGHGAGGLCLGADGEFHATTAPLTKGLNSFMTPINEMACNGSGDPFDSTYGFPSFGALNGELDITTTTAAFGPSLAAPVGFEESRSGDIDLGAGNPPTLAWDDSDLTFNMDMDLDMDLDLDMGGNLRA